MSAPITQADREAAWPFVNWHCLPDRQMRERFFSGYYDAGGPLFPEGDTIKAFAAHRIAAERIAAGPWECFRDASYYDMWLVRQVHDRTFGQGFHLINGDEAAALRDLLNREVLKGEG